MSSVPADLRHDLRMLARERGFAAVAILTLALGIGANTAIFSVVDGVLLRPLPYPEPERLFAVHEHLPKVSHLAPSLAVSAHHFAEWRKHATAFEQIAIVAPRSVNLSSGSNPERVYAARVSAALFPMLGAQMKLGRSCREEGEQLGRDTVVILSESRWRNRFGADPAIAGKTVTLDGVTCEVAGVAADSFRPPRNEQLHPLVQLGPHIDVWKPAAFSPEELSTLGDFNFGAIARLKRGVTPQQAVADLNAIQADIVKSIPEKVELKTLLIPLERQMAGGVRRGLLVMMAAVGGVLPIGCVNLANLLLARHARRGREMAVRAALGASRGRLIRQTLVESLLIASLGGALGVLLAIATRLLTGVAPVDLPRLDEVRVDWRVMGFSLVLSALTGVLFGSIPAFRSAGADPQDAMRNGGRSATDGPRGVRVRGLLVRVEVALSAHAAGGSRPAGGEFSPPRPRG